MPKRMSIVIYAIAAALLINALLPGFAWALPVKLSASTQTAFDKLVAESDSATSSNLTASYSTLAQLDKDINNWDRAASTLRHSNEEALILLRKQLRQVNSGKLEQLEKQVQQTKVRYQPLFTLYSVLNDQLKSTKPSKDKELNAALKRRVQTMKITVQLAKQDIKAKEQAWKAEKNKTSKLVKSIRLVLTDIDVSKTRIKSEKSAASSKSKEYNSTWKMFNQSVKKSDKRSVATQLNKLTSLSRQISTHKQRIHEQEQKISAVLAKAKAMLP
ncbi:hypothetical protein EBB07_09235 [Paenibacillaceae bacterium]|nr:hypothetical protein EBB07_09235 [Paenibacillaceae bacterium]